MVNVPPPYGVKTAPEQQQQPEPQPAPAPQPKITGDPLRAIAMAHSDARIEALQALVAQLLNPDATDADARRVATTIIALRNRRGPALPRRR